MEFAICASLNIFLTMLWPRRLSRQTKDRGAVVVVWVCSLLPFFAFDLALGYALLSHHRAQEIHHLLFLGMYGYLSGFVISRHWNTVAQWCVEQSDLEDFEKLIALKELEPWK